MSHDLPPSLTSGQKSNFSMTPTVPASLLDVALAAHRAGLAVFPTKPPYEAQVIQ